MREKLFKAPNFILFLTFFASSIAGAQSAKQDAKIVQEIFAQVRSSYNRQERPVVIFDLDGTLFDNRHRILKIIQDYGEEELKQVRPKLAKILAGLTVNDIRYRLPDTLRDARVTEEAVMNNASIFWSERFFNDSYIKYDKPTDRSVQLVRNLYSSGARIIYLTGRDAPRQLLGTVKALRDHGFPIGIQGTELIMKPTMQTQDAVFKQQVTNYLRHYSKVVAAFDNEPANLNVYRRAFPKSYVVRYTAPSSPNPPPLLEGIHTLSTF